MTVDHTLIGQAVRDSSVALGTVVEALDRLDGEALRAPSGLPDWSRGHVLAHLEGVGAASARQAEAAARGEVLPFYDGGREARDAAIEGRSGLGVEEHAEALSRVATRLEEAWPESGSPLWEAPTGYRDGTPLSAVAMGWWREVRIHLVDLQVGVGACSWDDALCRHLLDFLSPRLDGAGRIELVATDAEVEWSLGHGQPGVPLVVRGTLRDVVAWVAGREPDGEVAALHDGAEVELPELGPWPSISADPRPPRS